MPIYEYKDNEGNVTEVFYKNIKDAPETIVIEDKKGGFKEAKRIISKGSFELKGNGWAKDSYSKK